MIKTRKPGWVGIAGQTWILPVFWVAVVALALGAAAPMGWAKDDDEHSGPLFAYRRSRV